MPQQPTESTPANRSRPTLTDFRTTNNFIIDRIATLESHRPKTAFDPTEASSSDRILSSLLSRQQNTTAPTNDQNPFNISESPPTSAMQAAKAFFHQQRIQFPPDTTSDNDETLIASRVFNNIIYPESQPNVTQRLAFDNISRTRVTAHMPPAEPIVVPWNIDGFQQSTAPTIVSWPMIETRLNERPYSPKEIAIKQEYPSHIYPEVPQPQP
jgi:hypothetical protein